MQIDSKSEIANRVLHYNFRSLLRVFFQKKILKKIARIHLDLFCHHICYQLPFSNYFLEVHHYPIIQNTLMFSDFKYICISQLRLAWLAKGEIKRSLPKISHSENYVFPFKCTGCFWNF